jgi:hypothetical protein
MKCSHCGTDPQPLHDELPIPVCCEKAQAESIYGKSERKSVDQLPPKIVNYWPQHISKTACGD